jgi:uncharacterized membrane protein YraQ (UPF0718 family)
MVDKRFAEFMFFSKPLFLKTEIFFMIELLITTCIMIIVSLVINRKRTIVGFKIGLRMFLNMLPPFITVLVFIAVVLALLPEETLAVLLGKDSGAIGFTLAAVIGSISLIPGFVAFPLSAVLLQNGVSYPVISVFITTLMMVGIVTLPLEKKYFGMKVALMRNSLSLAGAVIIGVLISLLWSLI